MDIAPGKKPKNDPAPHLVSRFSVLVRVSLQMVFPSSLNQSTRKPKRQPTARILVFALISLVWWLTRLPALQTLPLHNDEGLHLTRAVEVWNLHPFWEIRDGKIVNQFVIAAFYPQNAPVFVGRIATLFIALIGVSAGYALVRRRFGLVAAILGGIFWIASAYLLFFERLAFSDAEAGALVVLALLASDYLARTGRVRDALLTGLCFGLAALFKFTAFPFALSIAVIVLLTARYSFPKRLMLLVIGGLVTAVLFVIPIGYLVLRGADLFSIALGWIGVSGGSGGFALFDNLARLWATLIGFSPTAAVLLVIGLIALAGTPAVYRRAPTGWVYLLALALPLAVILVFGREVLPRHFVVALPLALILSGAGWVQLLIPAGHTPISPRDTIPGVRALGLILVLAVLIIPFAVNLPTQWNAPDRQSLPDTERRQFITEHSAGYGLREAVQAFPQTVTRAGTPIVASMFPDSCRRANFYAADGFTMRCTDAPGVDAIILALNEQGAVYMLVETPPLIGADIPALAESLGAQATRLAGYPRPGETAEEAAVTLWLVELPR